MAETAKYGGKEYTWAELVKKVGVDRARVEAPELDPKYQEMVRTEGQAKANVDYSRQYVDPQTEQQPGVGATLADWAAGTEQLKKRGGFFPTALADLAQLEQSGGVPGEELKAVLGHGTVGRALFGGKAPPSDPSKAGGKKTTGARTQPQETLQQAEDAAINQMYQGVLSQFQNAASMVNPYISGAAMAGQANNAQALANRVAGGGVQGPDPSIQGVLSKDFQAQAAANQAGQQGVANAISGMNQASQAQANVSPYSQLLNSLASKAQYNIVYQGAQPNVAGSPGYVAEALNAANQYSPASAAGAAPVGGTPAPVTTSGPSLSPAPSAGAGSTGG